MHPRRFMHPRPDRAFVKPGHSGFQFHSSEGLRLRSKAHWGCSTKRAVHQTGGLLPAETKTRSKLKVLTAPCVQMWDHSVSWNFAFPHPPNANLLALLHPYTLNSEIRLWNRGLHNQSVPTSITTKFPSSEFPNETYCWFNIPFETR
jgi:hypothetical protein